MWPTPIVTTEDNVVVCLEKINGTKVNNVLTIGARGIASSVGGSGDVGTKKEIDGIVDIAHLFFTEEV